VVVLGMAGLLHLFAIHWMCSAWCPHLHIRLRRYFVTQTGKPSSHDPPIATSRKSAVLPFRKLLSIGRASEPSIRSPRTACTALPRAASSLSWAVGPGSPWWLRRSKRGVCFL
jgi:hypothetical protein